MIYIIITNHFWTLHWRFWRSLVGRETFFLTTFFEESNANISKIFWRGVPKKAEDWNSSFETGFRCPGIVIGNPHDNCRHYFHLFGDLTFQIFDNHPSQALMLASRVRFWQYFDDLKILFLINMVWWNDDRHSTGLTASSCDTPR